MPIDQIPATDYSTLSQGTGVVGRDLGLAMQQYSNIAREGILGPGGAEGLSARAFRSGAGRRKALGGALRKRLRKRLGSRSLAAETTVANTITAPSLASADARTADFELENLKSKFGGLEGLRSLIAFVQNQANIDREFQFREDEVGGLGGILNYALPGAGLALDAISKFTGGGGGSRNRGRRTV